MKCRASIHRVFYLAGPAAACAAALLLFALTGCVTPKDVLRPQQAEETPRERYGLTTIGDYCEVADLAPKSVAGIGVVTCLDGTGGDSPKDANRAALEKYLLQYAAKAHIPNSTTIGELMKTGSAALVLVSGQIPAGTRYGDHFDVEVRLPSGSKATSLRGGVLSICVLNTYDNAHGPDGMTATLKGTPIAVAEGPLQLSLGSSEGDEDAERLTKGHIWEGGSSRIYNTVSLVLNADQQFARKSMEMADRINQTFASDDPDVKIATAEGKFGVSLRVPAAYKLNIPHYLRVVRLIPMRDPGEASNNAPGQPKSYQQRLLEDLLDPARTVSAALRLEALGLKSVRLLQMGLASEHPLVRFCAAESLTYLGKGEGAITLAGLVDQQPYLRSYALSALASLDESTTRSKLQDLMERGLAHESRYGAFRALQALDPRQPLTQGELLNKSFWLHHVAPEGAPLLHVCTTKRAEVVQFGPDARLVPPFALESNGYTVVAHKATDDHCVIGVVPKRGNPLHCACSLVVSDVLHRLAQMDATYPEVVEILLDAANGKKVSCPVAVDALPQVLSMEELAAAGRTGDGLLELASQDLGATPTLYERPKPKPVPRDRNDTGRSAGPSEARPAAGQE